MIVKTENAPWISVTNSTDYFISVQQGFPAWCCCRLPSLSGETDITSTLYSVVPDTSIFKPNSGFS